MKIKFIIHPLVTLIFLVFSCSFVVSAKENKIPKPFRGDDPQSTFTINYADLDALLTASVLRTGRSHRLKAKNNHSSIGTRMKVRINKLTVTEGNRFYFEAFRKAKTKQIFTKIRHSLENLPTTAPLKYFTKKEQLAYWLNLYNVTMLEQLVKIYPRAKLKNFLTDNDSILKQKILTVAGIKLSLDDIQYNILMPKYHNDPLIIYGLYQGIIGGPDIRKHPYTAKNVYQALRNNANLFINSNRGTYAAKKKTIRVSSLYKRNKRYFPHFKKDLTKHLLTYIDGYTRRQLEQAKRIKANINDWHITDLYGSTRNYGGSSSTNSAALLDSVKSMTPSGAEGSGSGIGAANLSVIIDSMQRKTLSLGLLSIDQINKLKALNINRSTSNGAVTITDLSGKTKAKKE